MLSPSDAGTLFANGRFDEALQSLTAIESRRVFTVSEEVLLAEVFSLTGDNDAAIRLADRLIKQTNLAVNQRCRLRHVLGLCYFRKGENGKGAENYLAGITLAEQHGELAEECRLRVILFRHQLNWLGPQQAAADLLLLRRKVLHVGDPSVATTLQFALSELAAKLGLLPRARKHLDTARSLVSQTQDKVALADLKMNEVALAAMEGDFGNALQHALQLQEMGKESAYASKFYLPINLGHLLTIAARFDDALKVLEQSRSVRAYSGRGQVVLLDTLMQLQLLRGDLEEAASLEETIRSLLDRTQAGDSYFAHWHFLTRIRLLYRLGKVEDGVRLAIHAMAQTQRMAYRALLERITLLAAEGFGRSRDSLKGADLLSAAWRANPEPSPEVLAETARVAGQLTAPENARTALEHFERARVILEHIGNLAGVAEITSDISALRASGIRDQTDEPPDVGRLTVASTASRIATLIEVGARPALLAKEALSLISATDSALHARIVATEKAQPKTIDSFSVNDTDPNEDLAEALRISLGVDRGRTYELIVLPRPTASARINLLAAERLVHNAQALARARQLEREHEALWPEQPAQQLGLICSSERMLDLVKTIQRVAGSNVTVLLTGETGVGKELFARALHQASARSEKVFLPFNCTTVPRDMFDSQLFGHKRGSFTGAHEDSLGVVRAAAGGTLFLDEIGELSLDVQPKLLRFLESSEVQPLGDPKPKLVDVRVVAATNANLDQLVADARFREDLFYRLNVIRINIPPLRERREEIPALVEHFLERYGRELEKPMLRIADETLEYLVLYRWPGNVRQLANEIRRLAALAEPGSILMPAHLSDDIVASRRTIPAGQLPRGFSEVITRIDQPLAAAVEHVERAAIQRALSVTGGHMDEAARMLGLSRKGLYLKRQRLNLE
jgi:DNA-binding NtrC family response regulator